MKAKKYKLTRDVTKYECHWLVKDCRKGSFVYEFIGATYGCIGPGGTAVTLGAGQPFFELPLDALEEIE